MMITKAQVELVKAVHSFELNRTHPHPNRHIEALSALIAVGEKLADGSHVILPANITAEMAWELENNFATPLPVCDLHRVNWHKAYRAMIAASK